MAEKKMAEFEILEIARTENARIGKYQNWKMTELENDRME
jgi:hypothetical protein